MNAKQIILVDDHIVVRNGLKMLIEKLGDYKICYEFGNGKELLEAHPFPNRVDLIVMDISMPEMDGDEAMEILNERDAEVPVLILTLTQEDERILKLFRMGVRGYIRKDCSAEVLKSALEDIFRYGYYHNEFLTYSLRHDRAPKKLSEKEVILQQLSDREREFLRLVCHENEYTYDQIAAEMGVQHRTVDGYRESVFEKFAIKSKTGLVLFVLKHQLLDAL